MKIKPATIKDVARASGVSSATVSYVINGGPRRVDPVTAARVMDAMERLNYHPSTMARGLNKMRLDCLGVVFPQMHPSLVNDSYFSAVLDGIIQVATQRKQNVTLYTGLEWKGRASLPAFRDRRVDALILIATLTDSDIIHELSDSGMPFVLINNRSNDPHIPWVDIDNEGAAERVVDHLVQLGHRRIAHITGEPNSPSTVPRRSGFLKGMEKHGLPVGDDYLFEVGYWREAGSEGLKRLMSLPDRPTAVFCGGDGIAVGAYEYCSANNVRIPEDVSIVGFDDAPFLSHMQPGLTTVHHPLVQLGAKATSLILNKIDIETAGRPYSAETVILDVDLVVRESTGKPPILK